MLAHGLTDAPQYGDNYWIMPVFYALLGLSATAASNPTPGFRFPRFKPWAVALAAVSVLTIIAAILVIIPDIYFTNLGAIRHTRADLATFKDKSDRQFVLEQAINDFQRALKTNEHQPTANWRLGLIALDSDQFREAIQHLEIAHSALPHHRGVTKALGYAYLWDGQVDRAAALLASLEEIPQELDYWNWWRREQGQDRLAEYGQELQMRLLQESE
jgi:tetratricopeptide (TPR) repeat protein